MKILSIETSCDETGVSILECSNDKKGASFKILANSLNSQIKIHSPYGGVFPALAKREHIKNLPILLERTLKNTKLETTKKPVDLIVVTSGPGLEPALWTGIVFAKELAKKWDIPVMPVNHMEGHILSVFGKNKGEFSIPLLRPSYVKNSGRARQGSAGQAGIIFPVLSLLVSGGHTELVLSNKIRDYKIIGETLDDAAGEAFDKVARMLELPYPGGPEISKLAEKARAKEKQYFRGVSQAGGPRGSAGVATPDSDPEKIRFSFALPRPMMYSKNFIFSFSGLKTAVLYLIRDLKEKNPKVLENEKLKQAIALEFENTVVETLIHKTKKAVEKYNIQTIIVAGGVSSNKFLRKEMKRIFKEKIVLFPDKNLATDNSVMIGMAGYVKYLEKNGKIPKNPKIKADGSLRL